MSTAINLQSIFGNEIIVNVGNRLAQRSYRGYVGAHGLTSKWLGTRGYTITVTGRLFAEGIDYATARASLQDDLDAIELITSWLPDVYTFGDCVFDNLIWDSFQPQLRGPRMFRWDGASCICDFIAVGKGLI